MTPTSSITHRFRVTILVAFLIMALFVTAGAASGSDSELPPKNIILFVGDGMGASQRLAAQWYSIGLKGRLAMDSMPHKAMIRTNSADSPVTDSAAAATAMATGAKTNNGKLSMDASLAPLRTILEMAKAKGKRVGLVTTTQMAHATPAAFAAHVANRWEMTAIAAQMAASGIDVLLGGGEDEFLPAGQSGCYPGMGKRDDGRQLIRQMVAGGYAYVCRSQSLAAVNPERTPLLLGLFADEQMVRPFAPTLAEMTGKALEILSRDEDGYFLMVEGGQIDWACHKNDTAHVIADVISLDAAVKVAQTFAASHPATLIIVVADHETGGMQLSSTSAPKDGEGPFAIAGGGRFFVQWSTDEHTGRTVPLSAQGPFASRFHGEMDNTDIFHVMRSSLR